MFDGIRHVSSRFVLLSPAILAFIAALVCIALFLIQALENLANLRLSYPPAPAVVDWHYVALGLGFAAAGIVLVAVAHLFARD